MLNKVSIVLNVILLAAVAFLFVRIFGTPPEINTTEAKEEATEAVDSVAEEASGSRIAYVDAEKLNEGYTFIAEKYEELEKEQMRLESQIDRKMRAAEERYRELESQAPTMTPSELEQAQIELQTMQQDIAQFQEKVASDFRKKEAATQEQFFSNIRDYLQAFNQDNKYDYILTYQIGGQVLLANDALDITEEVLAGLNQHHSETKNPKKNN